VRYARAVCKDSRLAPADDLKETWFGLNASLTYVCKQARHGEFKNHDKILLRAVLRLQSDMASAELRVPITWGLTAKPPEWFKGRYSREERSEGQCLLGSLHSV